MTSRLELANIAYRFGVHRLSLAVGAGEIYGLIGPDGAGKTTALRIAAGLLDPTGGTVRICDRATFDTRTRELLGYMPQQYSLYGDLSVSENLAFFREMYGLSRDAFRARRDRLLHLTRLAEFRDRRASALSGGMYKKLALACALLHEPAVLLLDEPTTGVDPVSRRELWELLHEFLAEGMAIVIATPYMDEAARCHRAGMLYEGALLAEGTPGELVAAFHHPVFAVHGARTAAERAIESDPNVLAFTPAGAQLRIVVREGHEADVTRVLAGTGATLEPTTATFEDLFLASVRERSAA
jgi:drug efflux transport system ATP-binding protein